MKIVKYDDETQAEYEAFVAWYLSSPRRAPKDPDLAARNDWTMRAMMLDGSRAPAIEDRKPQDEEAEAALKRLLFLEAGKFLGRSEAAPGIPTLTPTELLRLATIVLGKGVVTEREAENPEIPEEEPDLSNLSDEELAILSKIAKK